MVFFLALAIIGAALGIVSLLLYFHVRPNLIRNIPQPPMWPLLGNGFMFVNNTPPGILLLIKNLVRTYGKRFQVALGPDHIFFSTDAKDFEEILTSTALTSKAKEYDVLRNWLGDGLLLSSGRKWHSHRKSLTPAFHFKILEQFTEIFHQQSDILVNSVLSKFSASETVDIYPLITLMALDVICETAMGVRVNAQKNSDSDYVKAVKVVAHVLHLRMFDVLLRWTPYFNCTTYARQEKRALKTLHSFTDSVIDSRRKELQSIKTQNESGVPEADLDYGINRKMNLIDLLLQTTCDGQPLTDREIREEVDTFMFEGHDTTTSALAFAIYLFASNPEKQEKAFQEIKEVFGGRSAEEQELNGPASLHTLNELHYLELCIKETLRLFPSVPVFGRKVTEDVVINGAHLKKGTSVIAGCHFMQRDPDYFSDPDDFIPERFLEDRIKDSPNPFVFVPFSAGPRNCIGQKFAMYEMKSTLSKLLINYEFKVDQSYTAPVLVAELILKSQNGILVNVRRRAESEKQML